MMAFEFTTPKQPVATWLWRIFRENSFSQEQPVIIRFFGASGAATLEQYLQEHYPQCTWYVYGYEASEAAVEIILHDQVKSFKKCNLATLSDTITLYHPDELEESSRTTWREWLKTYDHHPYAMMLPNQETSSLMGLWVAQAKQVYPSLIKDDWIDAFVSVSTMATTSFYQCQPELTQAAMAGVLFFGRLTNQPESFIIQGITKAVQDFSLLTSITDETLQVVEQWITNDYIQD